MNVTDRKVLHYVKRMLGMAKGNREWQPFIEEAETLISIVLTDSKYRKPAEKERIKLVTK